MFTLYLGPCIRILSKFFNQHVQGKAIRVEFGDSTTTIDPTCANMVVQEFPNTFGQPLVHFLKPNKMDAQANDEHPPIRFVFLFQNGAKPHPFFS